MKISLRWLNDFVDVTEFLTAPQPLADRLTAAGLEVEEITNRAKDYENVVVGLILEKDRHPNADKLSLCKVTTGQGVVHQIVCGAQNHKANDKVIVALPGAVLPGNFAIKQSVIRGVDSGGMLCSLKELGLAQESNGIEILPEEAPIGESFAKYQGLDDVTVELKVTPNRSDCLSHYGLAREIAALLERPLKVVKPEWKPASDVSVKVDLQVKESRLCPRYCGRAVQNVKVGPSPTWLKKRLESVGMKSINNIVDVTNYVMMELGQPMHAFDAASLAGSVIRVDKAKAGEKFTTLDGTQITLTGEELMIADAEKALAMAGVIGGQNSGVTDATTNIFLESAFFLPATVRKSLRAHGITTDSGYRFSRGVDPNGALVALDRATELILQVAGGQADSKCWDIFPEPSVTAPITISAAMVSDRLGYTATEENLQNYLLRLGCKVEKKDDRLEVQAPSYRFDLETEMDLVEEYARIHGYEHIPESLPSKTVVPSVHDREYESNLQISQILRGQGYSQAMNFAFVSEAQEKQFVGNFQNLNAAGLNWSEQRIRLMNPLSEDLNVMRGTLSYGLYKNIVTNFHQGNHQGRLFEYGGVFHWKGSYQQTPRLALAAWGQLQSMWDSSGSSELAKAPVVFELKSAIESLLKVWKIQSYEWITPQNRGEVPSFLHRGQYAWLKVEGRVIGFIGTLHPTLVADQKLRVDVALAELDAEVFVKSGSRGFKFQSLSKFQAVERDLSLVMSKQVASAAILKEIKKVAGPLLVSVQVVDMYQGDKLPVGQKSLTVRLHYQSQEATLQDAVIQEQQQKVLAALEKQFSASLR